MLIQMMLSIRLKVYSMHRCSIIADIDSKADNIGKQITLESR